MEPEVVIDIVKKERDDPGWINEEVIIKEEIVDNEGNPIRFIYVGRY